MLRSFADGKAAHDVAVKCPHCGRLVPVMGVIGYAGRSEHHETECSFCGGRFVVTTQIGMIPPQAGTFSPAGILDENGRQIDPPWEESHAPAKG